MKAEPTDKYFGIPLGEWIERIPNELEVDAVGLWQIIPVGRDSFALSGDDLRDFVRRAIMALLQRGALPVKPKKEEGVFWCRQDHYGDAADSIAENIIAEWEKSGVDPDEDGLWFTLLT